jgi:hypothetical protein
MLIDHTAVIFFLVPNPAEDEEITHVASLKTSAASR